MYSSSSVEAALSIMKSKSGDQTPQDCGTPVKVQVSNVEDSNGSDNEN